MIWTKDRPKHRVRAERAFTELRRQSPGCVLYVEATRTRDKLRIDRACLTEVIHTRFPEPLSEGTTYVDVTTAVRKAAAAMKLLPAERRQSAAPPRSVHQVLKALKTRAARPAPTRGVR